MEKKFNLGEVKKTVLKVKKNLLYNDNVFVKVLNCDEQSVEVLISIKEIDYSIITIDFLGLFDIPSLYDWILLEINNEIKNMLQDYIYKR